MLKLFVLVLLIASGFASAFAFEPIPITISDAMNSVIFDGRWTQLTEWKESSLNTYTYDDTQIILRSAHQGDFIYIFLDPINDYSLDKLSDRAVICFDTKNNKSTVADSDDYCFMSLLEGNGTVYQGDGTSQKTNYFEKIPYPEGYIGISSVSDNNDRYTLTPHPSYEFRIPTNLVGRENVYGFYFLVYDDHLKKSYTYPQGLSVENFVSDPDEWGEIYSPDKSLPEFGLPVTSLVLSFGMILFLTRLKHCNLLI